MRSIHSTALFIAVAALLSLVVLGLGQVEAEEPDAQKLWKMLSDADYQSWQSYPGTPDELYEGTRPHGAKLRTYANDVVAVNPDDPPVGSIIVKENYKPNEELEAITVMKRVEGYDPDNNDWFWVKYLSGGKVAEEKGTTLAGKVDSCIGCHASAAGDDYVYTNDEK